MNIKRDPPSITPPLPPSHLPLLLCLAAEVRQANMSGALLIMQKRGKQFPVCTSSRCCHAFSQSFFLFFKNMLLFFLLLLSFDIMYTDSSRL